VCALGKLRGVARYLCAQGLTNVLQHTCTRRHAQGLEKSLLRINHTAGKRFCFTAWASFEETVKAKRVSFLMHHAPCAHARTRSCHTPCVGIEMGKGSGHWRGRWRNVIVDGA